MPTRYGDAPHPLIDAVERREHQDSGVQTTPSDLPQYPTTVKMWHEEIEDDHVILARIEEGERVPAVRCNVNRQSHAAQPAA